MADIVVTVEEGGADVDIGANIQVVTLAAGGLGGVANLADILDVDTSNLDGSTNKYVMVYDAVRQKYVFVNPDAVIDASVGVTTSDPAPAGMTQDTIDYLDKELDNKIDLDAGQW